MPKTEPSTYDNLAPVRALAIGVAGVHPVAGALLAAEAPVHMPTAAHTTVAPPRRRWTLRDAYRAWRGQIRRSG